MFLVFFFSYRDIEKACGENAVGSVILMRLLVPIKCTCCCHLEAKQVQAPCDGLDRRSKYFQLFSGFTSSMVPFTSQEVSRLQTSEKFRTSRFPVSELQVGAKNHMVAVEICWAFAWSCWSLILLEKLSQHWFLGKMGRISMNQLCCFIPALFFSRSSSFLLGPKAELALLTALIQDKAIFLAKNKCLQYLVLPVCGWGGETKHKGIMLHSGRFAGLFAAGTTFFLAVEQHFFFVAEGRHDLLSHTHETGEEWITSWAGSVHMSRSCMWTKPNIIKANIWISCWRRSRFLVLLVCWFSLASLSIQGCSIQLFSRCSYYLLAAVWTLIQIYRFF